MAKEIDWSKIERQVVREVTSEINESLEIIKEEVDRNTPIDTGTLIADTKINPAKREWNRISGSVSNETEYAKYVEYGVQGKTFNYHKMQRVFYVGVGARMFTRAYDRMMPIVIKKIKSALNR